MIDAEETKRFKAKQLRYKKPIVKNLNLDSIKQDLWDIQEECENVRWYTESEDGNDSLINALAGDEDEAYGQYSRGLYFKTKEDCQKYCDWLNEKSGATDDMTTERKLHR